MSDAELYPCQKCGHAVGANNPGTAFVNIAERVLTIEELLAGAPPPPSVTYAYCETCNPYKVVKK